MAVISTATHPIPCSFITLPFSSPVDFFLLFPWCSFLSFRSRLLCIISPSCLYLSFFSPNLLPFCSFLAINHFFHHIFSYCYISLCYYLSPFFVVSLVLNCLSVSASSGRPHPLVLFHLLNLSTCLYLCLLSAMTLPSHLKSILFISFSFSILFLIPSVFVFSSAVLLCLAHSRQAC